MKKMRAIFIVITCVISCYIAVVLLWKDDRLVGVYAPDAIETHATWKPWSEITLHDTYNILGQIFQEAPVQFTTRKMALKSGADAVTNRYWTLWKRSNDAVIFVRPFTVFHVTYTLDGMWMKIIPNTGKSLHAKMLRLRNPDYSLPWWLQAETRINEQSNTSTSETDGQNNTP
ncbi:MAG: hypothetical protein H7A43_08860 [Verrucomicrobia bacterium]|nr:hypothetical protein [Verrucomicrobiota bacterium]